MSGGSELIATVIPVLNEEDFIGLCLDSLIHQTMESSNHMILVLDGGSSDRTVQCVESAAKRSYEIDGPRIELHTNPGKHVAEARNLALTLLPSTVHYMIELIGHSTVPTDHLEVRLKEWKRIESLDDGALGAVGVRVESRRGNLGVFEGWVEGCLQSPFGSGSGQFSRFKVAGVTQTPAFCMHSRAVIEDVGGWNTSFITSQDSDLSMRLSKHGYGLYRTPATSVYMAKRTGILRWWRMGHRYGFWRTKVLRQHPRRASAIEFLPWIGALLSLFALIFIPQFAWLLPAMYGLVLLFEGIRSCIKVRRISNAVGVPLCLLMLHTSFSIGLLDGLVRKGRPSRDR